MSRSTIFIRELPEVSCDAVEAKLRPSNVPPLQSCEAAGPASWYLNFSTEEMAQSALAVLLQEGQEIFGQAVMARIQKRMTTQPVAQTDHSWSDQTAQFLPVTFATTYTLVQFPLQQHLGIPQLILPQSFLDKMAIQGLSPPSACLSALRSAPIISQQSQLPPSSRSLPVSQGEDQRGRRPPQQSRFNRGNRRNTGGHNRQDSGRKPQGQCGRVDQPTRINGSLNNRQRQTQQSAERKKPVERSFDLQLTSFPPLSSTSVPPIDNAETVESPAVCWNGKLSSTLLSASTQKRQSIDLGQQNVTTLEAQVEKLIVTEVVEEKKVEKPIVAEMVEEKKVEKPIVAEMVEEKKVEPTAEPVKTESPLPPVVESTVKLSYAKMAQKTFGATQTEHGKQRE